MAYQSKTYSLSDEVIEAIEAARERGLTPNRFLRQVLGLDDPAPDRSSRYEMNTTSNGITVTGGAPVRRISEEKGDGER